MIEKLILKVALYQMDSTWKSPEQNLIKLAAQLQALPEDTEILILPEMWSTGFVMDPQQSALPLDHTIQQAVQSLASDYTIDIVGSMAVSDRGHYYNRALWHSAVGTAYSYDKQYLFSPSGEGKSYTSGQTAGGTAYKGWNVQLQICYDLRFPASNATKTPPDIIIYMANWPAARIHHWNHLLIARAIENQCYVIGCNRVGTDGNGWTFPGQSQIIDFSGKVVAVAGDDPSVLSSSLDKEQLIAYRAKYPFYQDKKQ